MKSISLRLAFLISVLSLNLVLAQGTLSELPADIDASNPQECLSYINNTVIPSKFEYGWVNSFENYNTNSGRVLKVFYAYKKGDEKFYPVTWQNGGPGSPNRGWDMMASSLPDSSLVFVDQRGQGCSSGLPDFDNLRRKKIKKIKARLKRYKLFLSRGIVHDMEKVRKHLFGENSQWVMSGQSFGSMITQRYVSLFPQSLAAAHGHGFGAIKNPKYFAKRRILSHIEQMDKYFEKYPEDRELLSKMKKNIKKKFCVNISSEKDAEDIIASYCGKYIIDLPGLILTAFPNWHKTFHDYLNTHFHPGVMFNKKSFRNAIQTYAQFWGVRVLHFYGGTDLLNIVFNRYEAYTPKEKSLSKYYKKLHRKITGSKKNVIPMGEESYAHFSVDKDRKQDEYRVRKYADKKDFGKKDPILPKNVFAGLEANPDLKLNVYAGKDDAISSPDLFEEISAHPQVEFEILEGGHGSFHNPKFFQGLKLAK